MTAEEYGSSCPHHPYMVEFDRQTEKRLQELEKLSASNHTMIGVLCEKMTDLVESINTLILSYGDIERKSLARENRIQVNEDSIKEIRGWIVGAASALLITFLGWIIWWLQNYGTLKILTE